MVRFVCTKECLENSDDEFCIYVRYRTYQDMDHGEWSPHFRPDNRLVSYHGGVKSIVWDADLDGKDREPKDGDTCPVCGRKVVIFQ